jgi:perosamine synthetase
MSGVQAGASKTQAPGRRVPFFQPDITEEEIDAVVETLRSGWLTMGPVAQRFETEFAAAVGAPHAIAVNSCTAALHLALDALALQPGDEVITSTFTFAASAATIIHAGGRPVLVDVTPDTLNVDPQDVARKITPRTRAIVPVHFGGHPAPMTELLALAHTHNLAVVEDAAHALPAAYGEKRIGTIGDMTAFSFYATKNLTTGEGGMLTMADAGRADEIRVRRLHGMSRDAWGRYTSAGSWRYDVTYPGFKYNMNDLAAAIGRVQLRRLPAMHERRRALAALYTRLLEEVSELQLPGTRREVDHGWHLYPVRLRPEQLSIHRDQVIEKLTAAGIGTSVHFIPLHLHSYYREMMACRPQDFPVASAAADTILSLPFHTRLTDEDAGYVAGCLRDVLGSARR